MEDLNLGLLQKGFAALTKNLPYSINLVQSIEDVRTIWNFENNSNPEGLLKLEEEIKLFNESSDKQKGSSFFIKFIESSKEFLIYFKIESIKKEEEIFLRDPALFILFTFKYYFSTINGSTLENMEGILFGVFGDINESSSVEDFMKVMISDIILENFIESLAVSIISDDNKKDSETAMEAVEVLNTELQRLNSIKNTKDYEETIKACVESAEYITFVETGIKNKLMYDLLTKFNISERLKILDNFEVFLKNIKLYIETSIMEEVNSVCLFFEEIFRITSKDQSSNQIIN